MQPVVAMVKVWHVRGFADGDFTSGHLLLFARYKSRHGVVVQEEDDVPWGGCELPGVHS